MSEENTVETNKTQKELEKEGTLVADYIEGFLDIANLAGDIEIAISNNRVKVSIVSDNLITNQALRPLGKREFVLALQELSKTLIWVKTGKRSNLILDIAGYRKQQQAETESYILRLVEQVKITGKDIDVKPMNSFERRVSHNLVSDSGLYSHSVGTGKERHLVISKEEPKDS